MGNTRRIGTRLVARLAAAGVLVAVIGGAPLRAGAATGVDYRVTAVSDPPAIAAPGDSFAVFDTTKNAGDTATSTTSGTNTYLSTDKMIDAGDTLLGGRGVLGLDAHASSNGGLNAHVPTTMALGRYFVIVCADDSNLIAESNETNNCRHSVAKVLITRPDYVVTALTDPPAAAAPGDSFGITDTTQNNGSGTSTTSATQYYLSLDRTFDAGDTIMAGRGVLGLAAGATSTGGVNAHVPSGIAPGRYFVIACADDGNLIVEKNETNNFKPSATRISIS